MTEFIEKELNVDLSLTKNKTNRHVFARCMVYYAFLDHMHMSFSASGKVFKKDTCNCNAFLQKYTTRP